MQQVNNQATQLSDFFISYKRKDTHDFVKSLAEELGKRNYTVWLDDLSMPPGSPMLQSIERGMLNSMDAIVVLSKNYCEGWSDFERGAIFALLEKQKIGVVPIWYQIGVNDVIRMSPTFANIRAIPVSGPGPQQVTSACNAICKALQSAPYQKDRRTRLYYRYFKCLQQNYPLDAELKMWVAVMENDRNALQEAIRQGANVNAKDSDIWNRYSSIGIDCCFLEWRKLLLHLHETGAIGGRSAP
jgi:hypothetical protein